MLITFKTLEQKTFKIEIDETEKVKVLKEKIAEERGSDQFPVAGQKLIYSGKILDDEKLISECSIDPVKNFVVVMVVKQKPKAAEKPKDTETSTSQSGQGASASAAAASTPTTTETTESPSTASLTSSESTTTAGTTDSTTSSESAQNTTGLAESALLTGTALESSITELMSLGYSREQVMRALNRSFHNADRAAEYLLSGNIPDMPEGDDEGSAPAVAPAAIGSGGGGGVGGDIARGDLNFLRNLPQFQLMRNQVQAHPESLPQLLQEIGRSNPELLSVISQHQEDFIALLNETSSADGGDEGGDVDSGAAGGAPGGPLQIQVTPIEKESIDRMVSMGFAEGEVIQAFFACDKNEQLAIEFLLNN